MEHPAPYPLNTWPFRISAWFILTTLLFKASTYYLDDGEEAGEHYGNYHLTEDDFDFAPGRGDPVIKSQRCDACRLIARGLDAAFELAEVNLLNHVAKGTELDEPEVAEVVSHVCSKSRILKTKVTPIMWRGRPRLAAKGLETYERLYKAPSIATPTTIDWTQRIRNHCRFLAEKMEGTVVYDMWLRTSADQEDVFESFVCYGDGVFGDCNEKIEHDVPWPAGDLEEEEEEEETEDGGEDDINDEYQGGIAQVFAKITGGETGEPDFLKGLDDVIDKVAEDAVRAYL